MAVFVHGCFWHHCPRCQARPTEVKSVDFGNRSSELNRGTRWHERSRASNRCGWTSSRLRSARIPKRVGRGGRRRGIVRQVFGGEPDDQDGYANQPGELREDLRQNDIRNNSGGEVSIKALIACDVNVQVDLRLQISVDEAEEVSIGKTPISKLDLTEDGALSRYWHEDPAQAYRCSPPTRQGRQFGSSRQELLPLGVYRRTETDVDQSTVTKLVPGIRCMIISGRDRNPCLGKFGRCPVENHTVPDTAASNDQPPASLKCLP